MFLGRRAWIWLGGAPGRSRGRTPGPGRSGRETPAAPPESVWASQTCCHWSRIINHQHNRFFIVFRCRRSIFKTAYSLPSSLRLTGSMFRICMSLLTCWGMTSALQALAFQPWTNNWFMISTYAHRIIFGHFKVQNKILNCHENISRSNKWCF